MKSFAVGIALVALVHAVAIDNTREAAEIHSRSVTLSGPGEYSFTNVASGKTLSFTRDDGASVTNVFAVSNGSPLSVQFGNDGQARLSGGNNKCVSAQWDVAFEGGVDNAAVSYACAVGSGQLTGTATLERTKQWWYLVPAEGVSPDDEVAKPAPAPQDPAPALLAAKEDDPSPAPPRASPFLGRRPLLAPVIAPAALATSPVDNILDRNHENDISKVVKTDRGTWICRHDAIWLLRHPKYVTEGGHTECAAELAAAQAIANASRMTRRSAHSQLAAKLRKRGEQQYYLIAVDHLHDMATRAITGHSMGTPGGYTSAVLSLWNKSDNNQLWTITR